MKENNTGCHSGPLANLRGGIRPWPHPVYQWDFPPPAPAGKEFCIGWWALGNLGVGILICCHQTCFRSHNGQKCTGSRSLQRSPDLLAGIRMKRRGMEKKGRGRGKGERRERRGEIRRREKGGVKDGNGKGKEGEGKGRGQVCPPSFNSTSSCLLVGPMNAIHWSKLKSPTRSEGCVIQSRLAE